MSSHAQYVPFLSASTHNTESDIGNDGLKPQIFRDTPGQLYKE